jgi:hypothetical protein
VTKFVVVILGMAEIQIIALELGYTTLFLLAESRDNPN